jgi:hypothetical protein
MTDPESTAPSGSPASSNEPLSTLRGAGVNVDARRVGRVVVGLCLVTLAVLVIVFTIAGFNNNSQINRLHHNGIAVTVTISGCSGLLGGSGSNVAGYTCKANFSLGGHHYTETLPGTAFHRPGASVRALVVPNDPALISPVSVESSQHASASNYVLPAVLLVILLLLVGLIIWLRRRAESRGSAAAF